MKKTNLTLIVSLFLVILLAACSAGAPAETVETQGVSTEVVSKPLSGSEDVAAEPAAVPAEEKEGYTTPAATATPAPWPTATYGSAEAGEPSRASGYEPVTAGVVDDNAGWDDYLNYLARNRHIWANHRDVSERYRIQVQDMNGQPVHDALVRVYTDRTLVFEGRTDAGGQLWFHPRAVAPDRQSGFFTLLVTKGGNHQAAVQENVFQRYDQQDWLVVLSGAPVAARTQLDLLFLIDATGSMSDEIEKLKATMGDIADQIDRLPERPDVRYGLVAYRDRGDRFIVQSADFTPDLGAFQRQLANLEANGGGDYPESVNEALHRSLHELNWRREDTVRMVLLVADAPPHLDYGEPYSYDTDMVAAVGMGVKIFPIGASGLDDQGEYIFRQLAQFTGGKFVFLTYADASAPGSGPGGETTHDVEAYSVETLDRLVVRLVTDELSRLPDPALAQGGTQAYYGTGQGSGQMSNPGFNPDNPVWFLPAPPRSAVQPLAWYVNGDFRNGLENWSTGHGSNTADRWGLDTYPTLDGRSGVLEFWRQDAGSSSGMIWLEQPLAVDVTGFSRMQVKADLKVIDHTLENSGWYCDANGCEGEYPLRLVVVYQAADGGTYEWSWGFLTRENTAQLRNYDIVPSGEWYAYESPNLLNLTPRPVSVQVVRLMGAGWDFFTQVDNLELGLIK